MTANLIIFVSTKLPACFHPVFHLQHNNFGYLHYFQGVSTQFLTTFAFLDSLMANSFQTLTSKSKNDNNFGTTKVLFLKWKNKYSLN